MEQEKKIKGGVIIMGSLFWEDENNAIQEKADICKGKNRREWRNSYLDLKLTEKTKIPILYGRCSSSRKCTYTMVFSNLALDKESYGLVIPYKSEIDFSNYLNFKRQAQILADIEGISKDGNRLRKSWGCIGLYINPKSTFSSIIAKNWQTLRLTDSEYQKKATQYRLKEGYDASLLTDDYLLSKECSINTDIDFLYFTYIKPEHRNKKEQRFPTPQEIAEEMLRSGYQTYFCQNRASGIITAEDNEIISYLNVKK